MHETINQKSRHLHGRRKMQAKVLLLNNVYNHYYNE